MALPDGSLWRNLVTEAKSKVAETLDEYRGQYRYNLLDGPYRRFHAQVPANFAVRVKGQSRLQVWSPRTCLLHAHPGICLPLPEQRSA